MRRQGRGELVPFDSEIERTINRLRKEKRLLVAHNCYLANMAENLQHNPNLREENELPGGNREKISHIDQWLNLMTQICYWRNLHYHLQSYSS